MLFLFLGLSKKKNVHRSPTRIRVGFFLIILNVCVGALTAQSVIIGTSDDARLRVAQLCNQYDSSVSLTVRPVSASSSKKLNWKPLIKPLPISLWQQYNSHHPYGWNDGSMISAKGYQLQFSVGMYTKSGPLEIQVQPEFIYAMNNSYPTTSGYGSKPMGAYKKLFPGQSFVKLSAGKISIGASSQNLWWGPGIRSSLLMSNNAPGFNHVYFATNKPFRTPIGAFEWQLIGGTIKPADTLAYENNNLQYGLTKFGDRYLSGLILSYQPKWIPGLFLGFTRAVQTYSRDRLASLNFLEKYIPVIALAIQKKDQGNEDSLNRDQLASFFLRWIFPKSQFEFYIEYGYNDYGYNVRDYLLGPSHSAAYITGIKKVISLSNKRLLDLSMEITQMSQSPDWLVRGAGNWYTHGQIKEGYSNQNQILGAGAGLGCNVQSISGTWISDLKKVGVLLERIDRNPQENVVKWIDFGFGIMPEYVYKNFTLSAIMEMINSKNYGWETNLTKWNLHARIGIQYHIK